MRVFVTGATGLVGSHVAAQLVARGDAVRVLVRARTARSVPVVPGAEVVVGDALEPEEVLAARLAGCDAVVHAAALVFRRGGWDVYRRANVEATERVLAAAARAGAARVVHVSSVAVYGGSGEEARLVEEEWLDRPIPEWNVYARSKREAEQAAWRAHEAGAVRVTTVRPAVIYGERDRHFTPWLARFARLPVVPLPGGGRANVPVVYAGNVARGIIAALDREAVVGRAYNLGMDLPVTARELVGGFARALGRSPRLAAVPAAPLAAVAGAVDLLLEALPWVNPPGLRRAFGYAVRGNPYDSTRARRELQWTELVDHAEALARTAAWWRQRGPAS